MLSRGQIPSGGWTVGSSSQQSFKWRGGGVPKSNAGFQTPPVSFHDCWRAGNLRNTRTFEQLPTWSRPALWGEQPGAKAACVCVMCLCSVTSVWLWSVCSCHPKYFDLSRNISKNLDPWPDCLVLYQHDGATGRESGHFLESCTSPAPRFIRQPLFGPVLNSVVP